MARLSSELILSLVDRVTAPARGVAGAMQGLQNRLEANSQRMDQMRGRMIEAAGAGYALFRALSAPVSAAADFEAAMNRVEAALGTTSQEFDHLKALAKEMGNSTQFSANESALAIEMLAKNGLSASQILGGALKTSMEVAASSGSDLAASSDVVTDVMANFNMEASQLGKVADGIAGVLLQSKFGFDDYRLAIGQAGGVAGGLGVTLQDFNTAIAATSSSFASGSDAGTSFKTFLAHLVPGTEGAAKAIEKLGLRFFDAQGNMRSMADISGELERGLAGLSDEDKNAALQTIFGTDGIRTALMLAKKGKKGFNELGEAIGKASSADQAAARMKGFWGELEKLRSSLEGLAITVGEALLPGLTAVVQALGPIVDAISAFAAANPGLTKALVGTTSALIALRVAAIAARFGFLWMGGAWMTSAIAGLKGMQVAVAGLGGAFSLLGLRSRKAGKAAFSGFSLANQAAVSAGASATAAKTMIAGMSNAGNIGASSRMIAGMSAASAAATASVSGLGATMKRFGVALLGILNPMALVQAAMVALRFAVIGTGIGAVLVGIAMAGMWIYQNWQGIKEMFAGIGEGIRNAFPGLGPIIEGVASAAGTLVGWLEKITGPIDASSAAWRAFGVSIGEGIGEFLAVLTGLPAAAMAAMQPFIDFFANLTIPAPDFSAVLGAFSWLVQGITSAVDTILGLIARASSAIASLARMNPVSSVAAGTVNADPLKPYMGPLYGNATAVDGARAAGGPVAGGRTYLVGEEGPELFTAGRSGAITPNHELGGGERRTSITFGNIIVQGSNASAEEIADAFSRRLQMDFGGLHADTTHKGF